jgi:hypothetical protein
MAGSQSLPTSFPYIVINDVARQTGYSRRSLWNKGKAGIFTLYRFAGGERVFMHKDDIEKLFKPIDPAAKSRHGGRKGGSPSKKA